jgi:hypothetical protein
MCVHTSVCTCTFTSAVAVWGEATAELKVSVRLALLTKHVAEMCAAAAAFKTQPAAGER